MKTTSRSYRLVAITAALAASSLLVACKGKPGAADAASAARPALTVQVTTVQQGTVPVTLKASGNISPWQDVSIASQSNGLRLAELRANVGDTVKKGQVLAVFAGDTINAEVLQAQANVLAAQAQAQDAQSNAARARSIADTGALSRQQINQMETAAKATAAQVQAARAVLHIQKTRQGYTRVIAPDDGVISSRTATVGAVVPAGMEMFRMVRQGRLEWRAELPGQDLAMVKPGLAAQITTSAGTEVRGRVRSVSPVLDAMKRVGMVFVDLENAQAQGARAGMYANGTIELGQMQGLLVPQAAVVTRDGFSYVFVLGTDNKVQQRRVETGAYAGDRVQIKSGLEAGTRIVHDGAGFLTDGDVVHVVTAPAAAASGAASSAASGATANVAAPASAASAAQ